MLIQSLSLKIYMFLQQGKKPISRESFFSTEYKFFISSIELGSWLHWIVFEANVPVGLNVLPRFNKKKKLTLSDFPSYSNIETHQQ